MAWIFCILFARLILNSSLTGKPLAMRRVLVLFVFLIMIQVAWSQPTQLIIQGETGKLFLEHTVVAGENWYSVGRTYNISPKEIAPFNGLTMSKPLSIGQVLKIPLLPGNFTQHTAKSSDESLVPVYHIIQEKEWMYHISTTYNRVPIESLEKWNHINKDQARAGMQLIVGYLKVKTAQSSLAGEAVAKTAVFSAPASKEPEKIATTGAAVVKNDKPVDATQKKPVQIPEPVASKSAPEESFSNANPVNTYATSHTTGGFFSADYSNSNKMSNGQAGTFKSTSGWHDGKYYALMNNVPVGTIVKVSSPSTNKSIYAKVLGQLPEMKESAGLSIRISNAAAADLGTGEGKFPVELKY
ncbi:MAG: hypothetical protein C5B59_02485 [Bacteroidetes bacterium]|nr:MAG: hypothetical protein C5B59_02485 [Bacteroidota bacterium]